MLEKSPDKKLAAVGCEVRSCFFENRAQAQWKRVDIEDW
jgi:hypothetical protein